MPAAISTKKSTTTKPKSVTAIEKAKLEGYQMAVAQVRQAEAVSHEAILQGAQSFPEDPPVTEPVTKPQPKPKAAKKAASAAHASTVTESAKATPPLVADYIATLPEDEKRYAAKAWRHAAGQRGTAPSLRGITKERAAAIREQVAGLIR
jgi:hypothetical protein